jgi:hypothetical protein
MFSSTRKIFAALVFALIFAAAPALAQDTPKPDGAKQSDKGVTEKGFRGRIFELKHRDPESLFNVLRPLTSGFEGSTMSISREMHTISVRDFPENLAAIEEALRRLDVAETPRPDIDLHVHILIASNGASKPGGDIPAELSDVVRQLQTTLSYKNYQVMSSQVLRGKEGVAGLGNKGVAELRLSPDTAANENPIFYEYKLGQIALDAAGAGAWKVQVGNFYFSMRIPLRLGGAGGSIQYENVGFNTPVGMREGEKVVVGTTTMQDKGVVIVLVANVIK